jgi:hypothetical protein
MTEIKKMYPYQLANVGKKYEDKWSKSFYMNVDDLIAWLKDIGLVYDGGGVWLSKDETKEAIEKLMDIKAIIDLVEVRSEAHWND